MYPEKRWFIPKRTDDLKIVARPYIGKQVTVVSWHENTAMKEDYPDDEVVGHVEEFALDVPRSELLLTPPA